MPLAYDPGDPITADDWDTAWVADHFTSYDWASLAGKPLEEEDVEMVLRMLTLESQALFVGTPESTELTSERDGIEGQTPIVGWDNAASQANTSYAVVKAAALASSPPGSTLVCGLQVLEFAGPDTFASVVYRRPDPIV
jgi:hypothetical protein